MRRWAAKEAQLRAEMQSVAAASSSAADPSISSEARTLVMVRTGAAAGAGLRVRVLVRVFTSIAWLLAVQSPAGTPCRIGCCMLLLSAGRGSRHTAHGSRRSATRHTHSLCTGCSFRWYIVDPVSPSRVSCCCARSLPPLFFLTFSLRGTQFAPFFVPIALATLPHARTRARTACRRRNSRNPRKQRRFSVPKRRTRS